MASASSNLPKKIRLNGVELSSDGMVLLSLNQHGERWVAYFAHPLLCEPVALPAAARWQGHRPHVFFG
ncbi:unnamed protein product [Effrenium voratum]|nr:unnamed protein product [Effrenium voratum]